MTTDTSRAASAEGLDSNSVVVFSGIRSGYEVFLGVDAVVLHVVVSRVHFDVVDAGHSLTRWGSVFPEIT